MSFWTNKVRRTVIDDAEELTGTPSGGPFKMWLLGIGLAVIPAAYGVRCLFTGHARLFGRYSSNLNLSGSAAAALAIAYISIGIFIHAHWFWGLHTRLQPLSYPLKGVAVLVFLGSIGLTIFKILSDAFA